MKAINLSEGVPEDFLITGYYFQFGYDSYLLHVTELKEKTNCKIEVYSLNVDTPETLKNRDLIKCIQSEPKLEYIVDVWGKYYFIKFDNNNNHDSGYQLYHDNNQIQSMAAVLEEARSLGLELAGIVPY